MKIIVIGLGSMGKRRIRLLKKYFVQYSVIGIDSQDLRCQEVKEIYHIETTYSSIGAALYNEPEITYAFICTPPLTHAQLISDCLNYNLHIFTELNLVTDRYQYNMRLAKEKQKVLFLSSTFLYRSEINYIIEKVKKKKSPFVYTYHVGQYLPDWHPWESFHNFFVKDKRSNGCRELFAIELPWLVEAFGTVKKSSVIKKQISNLDISYCDCYIVQFEHEEGTIGNLVIDIVSRVPVRRLEIFNEDIYLRWNGTVDSLEIKNLTTDKIDKIALYDKVDKLSSYSETIVENQYLEEMKEFFQVVNQQADARYSFEKDIYILDLIDKIESC